MHSVLVIKLVRAIKSASTLFHMASVLDLKISIGLLATIFIFIAFFDNFKELTMYSTCLHDMGSISLVYTNAWMIWHYFTGLSKIETATHHNQEIAQ